MARRSEAPPQPTNPLFRHACLALAQVLPVAKWRETEEEIFATHCIAHRASADLRTVTASA